MAIEGDFADVGLSSVIQMLCHEPRRMVLRLRLRSEEGRIFTDSGEVVHADVGRQEGEEALHHLLTWTQGSFHAARTLEVPPRTIRKPWAQVLIEKRQGGAKKSEPKAESRRGIRGNRTEAEAELDRVLADDLLALLSKAERNVDRLRGKKVQKRPATALQALEELVNQVITFSETVPNADLAAGSLLKALARANEKHPQVRLVHARNNRVSVETARNLYRSWGDDPADRSHMFRQIGRGLIVVLETYFALLAGYFASPKMAEEWRETYHVFVLDLIRALDSVKF